MGFALTKRLFFSLRLEAEPHCSEKGFYKTPTDFTTEFLIDLALSFSNFSWHPWHSWRWQ
jgi:hypothetical protein